jgi:TonB family protein
MTTGWNAKFRMGVSLFFTFCLLTCAPQQCIEGKILEDTLRRHAIKKVLPEFPYEAQEEKATGVVVAQVLISETGIVKSVEVLQAPHPAITQATLTAIKEWLFDFHSEQEEKPVCFKSKLTLYFVIQDGRAYVRNPKRFRDD